ncbi:MAG: molybdopterin molybdotransferase MoeA [bacterium]
MKRDDDVTKAADATDATDAINMTDAADMISMTTAPAPEVCDDDAAMVSAEHAQQLIEQSVSPLAQVESVAVRAALGRVAAADIASRARVPNHTNSAMDGYAFAAPTDDDAARGERELRVVGVSMAGRPFDREVGAGECVRIMTGAVMPAGADRVTPQERVERSGDNIVVRDAERADANVRRAGEDFEVGAVAIRAGCRLRPSHLGLAASLGLCELPVRRRARVALFSNGDELRPLGDALRVGELHDSNRYTLHGLLAESGAEMVDLGIVPDDADAVADAIERGAECADVVISSAGASVGDADYIGQTLARIGEVAFSKVAIKPGRPLTFARINRRGRDSLFFGLPGNPVSVMVTFEIFVKPALRRLAGETAPTPLRLSVKSASKLRKRPGRAEYQRGVLTADADGATVRSTGEQGSGILRSMGEANCFIILPTDAGDVRAGEMVAVQPFAQT